MNITSITPSIVHFVQTDEYMPGWYVRFKRNDWMICIGDSYEPISREAEIGLEEAFQQEVVKTGGLILQRKRKHPLENGSTPEWHDHPDMAFGPLPKLSDSLKEKLSAPGGEYLYRVVRKHYEVIWEGGEG